MEYAPGSGFRVQIPGSGQARGGGGEFAVNGYISAALGRRKPEGMFRLRLLLSCNRYMVP